MKYFLRFLSCFTVFMVGINFIGFSQTKQTKPNIIFIVIDDLGSGWLPPYAKNLKESDVEDAIIQSYTKQHQASGKFNLTKHLEAAKNSMPFLDKLSEQGVKFNKCFTTSSLCAPSRASMITGKYSQSWGVYTIPEIEKSGIPKNIKSLPEIFQSAGYSTAMIGKWHLAPLDAANKATLGADHFKSSSAPGYSPLDKGFDYYYGYNAPNSKYDNPKDLWEGNKPVLPAGNEFLTEVLSSKAKDFVEASLTDKKPFFLYYAPMTLHGGITPTPEKYSNKFDTGIPFTNTYAGHLLALDEGIKGIYTVLEANKQVENTLFIICSDNGSPYPVPPYNAPFKGGKGTGFLGGSHSPLIMVMPGKTKAMFSDQLVSTLDILPTALDIAGLKIPDKLDGISLKKLITTGDQENAHEMIFSSGLHSARWSYNYYDKTSKKNMDNENCPVYLWGIDNNNYSLQLTPVKPGLYQALPKGQPSQIQIFNYVTDPQNVSPLDKEDGRLLTIKSKEWLKKQSTPLRDRIEEHKKLISND